MSQDDQTRDAFEATLRQVHADALVQVSARTRAQLHQRRRAALATSGRVAAPPAGRRLGWPVAASLAALLAVSVGVKVAGPAAGDAPRAADAIVAAPAPASDEEALLALEETPDFYAWLASSEAVLLASE